VQTGQEIAAGRDKVALRSRLSTFAVQSVSFPADSHVAGRVSEWTQDGYSAASDPNGALPPQHSIEQETMKPGKLL